DRGHADTHIVYRDVRRLLERYSGTHARVSIGEIHLFDLAELVAYYGAELDELHMPFNFTLLNVPWTAEAVRSTVDEMEAAMPAGAWPNWVLGNHDESRVASRIGAAAARSAMLLLLTLRRAHPALQRGSYRPVAEAPAGVFAYERALGDERLLVLVNFLPTPADVRVTGIARPLVSTHVDPVVRSGACALRPHEGVVLQMG